MKLNSICKKMIVGLATVAIVSGYVPAISNIVMAETIQGDTTKEIEIPDRNLKAVLQSKYDIDGDGKITEHDMLNIVTLDIAQSNIANLEGLQHASNLKEIYAQYNNISDLTPLVNLEKITRAYFINNSITDISILKNAKWDKENLFIRIDRNFINFDNNNENYKVMKELIDTSTIIQDNLKLEMLEENLKQHYGNASEIDNEVKLDENLKLRLIEKGLDNNKDGKIARRELYCAELHCNDPYRLDLSNAGIADISGIEYVEMIEIQLNNNKIRDITPATKNKHIQYLNLNDNQISDITGIENCTTAYNIFLSNNRITDISTLANFKFENKTYKTTINLSNNAIDITKEGNKKAKEIWDTNNYTLKVDEQIKEEDLPPLEDETEITLKNATKEQIVNAINSDKNVTLDMNENINLISNEVFDSLSNKENKELKITTNNATWKFTSENITYKNIDLNPKVILSATKFENMSEPPSEGGIFIKFEHEGNLPGKAEIELDIKDYNVYGNNKTVYLYYFDSVKKKYEYISTVTTEDEKVKVVLEHCSEYVLLDKMIIELGDVNGDEKINARDAKLVLQYFNGNVELTAEQKAKADVNGDGKINARDAKLILQIFNGK